jgi:hypothetical protein
MQRYDPVEMRPPILEWKVFLALLAVLAVGVTLGSVLHPSTEPKYASYVSLASVNTTTSSAVRAHIASELRSGAFVNGASVRTLFILGPDRSPLGELLAWLHEILG